MNKLKYMDEKELIKKAVAILQEKLGPIETSRFLALFTDPNRTESVKRHREWQKNLDKDDLFKKLFNK